MPRTKEPATAGPGKVLLGRTKLKVRCFSVLWKGVVSCVLALYLKGVVVLNNLHPKVGRKIIFFALALSVRVLWCLNNFSASLLPSAQPQRHFRQHSTVRTYAYVQRDIYVVGTQGILNCFSSRAKTLNGPPRRLRRGGSGRAKSRGSLPVCP